MASSIIFLMVFIIFESLSLRLTYISKKRIVKLSFVFIFIPMLLIGFIFVFLG